MRRVFTISMMCVFAFMALSSQAQRVVNVPTTLEAPTDLFITIMGDTLEDGSRVDNNTIYKLQNGGFYIVSGRIVNKPEWPLVIEAEDLSDLDNKPALTTIPNASGTYPEISRPEGDLTLRNLWIIAGEKGPLENHEWGQIRLSGENIRAIVEDCIIEKDRGGFLQFRANGVKAYVDNCVFRNAGNRRQVQGNGRVIDGRNNVIDTLIVTNSVFHNIHDRVFRSQGATGAHTYIEFDRNTLFNHFGRHGCFQLARVKKAVITNNILSNPIMQGTTPVFQDEQTQIDKPHKVFTVDTLYSDTEFMFANNNIFWTQDVLDFWAANDTISPVGVYSQQILESIGGETAAADTYFSEVVEFNSVPGTIYQLLVDTYADPTSTEMFDIIVEDVARAGTDYDSGNLFEFATFDAGFDPAMYPLSASGATDGKWVGGVEVWAVSVEEATRMDVSNLKAYPNPTTNLINFEYIVERAGKVKVSVYDIRGQEQLVLVNESKSEGTHQLSVDLKSHLKSGMYLINLHTEAGSSVKKVILK